MESEGTLGPFGENLAVGRSSYPFSEALGTWMDDVAQYNASNPQGSFFTQVVWKATTQVGCGLAICNNMFPPIVTAAQFYVCEYSPPGNIKGEFTQNVQV